MNENRKRRVYNRTALEIRAHLDQVVDIARKLELHVKEPIIDHNTNSKFFKYSIPEVALSLPKEALSQIKPSGVYGANLSMSSSVELDLDNWINLKDPFIELHFRVCITAQKKDCSDQLHFGFHIDKDKKQNGYREPHPLYHLHYVLNHSKSSTYSFNYGQSMQLNVPRFVQFPMDIVTGLGFILNNFDQQKYASLIKDTNYLGVCKEHQKKLWQSYFSSLSMHFSSQTNPHDYIPHEMIPFLLNP